MSRFEWILIAGLGIAWIPGILALAEIWSTIDYASHGFLIPLVALWAATAHRVRLATLPAQPIRGGLLWIALTLVAYAIALLLRIPGLIGVTLVASVAVWVLALRGIEWVRTLAFSLSYLVFMIPLPHDWVTPLIVRLQLFVSSVAVSILQTANVAIYRDGNVMELPGGDTLFVAEACSGITSLVTLIPIGVFIAYFTESVFVRRLVMVAAVLPIALGANLLRVLLTVVVAIGVDVETATSGPLHEWFGVGIYIVGCLGLLAVGFCMRRFWPEPELPIAS